VRDQLRDRRTLFMIFVMPMLLYPLLGIGTVQLSAAFEQKPRTVVVVGPSSCRAEASPPQPAGQRLQPGAVRQARPTRAG